MTGNPMPGPDTILDANAHGPKGPSSRALLTAGAVVVVLLGGTLALWAHVGTAVFFETIRAGIMACF
jgi:hypothetical protein